MEHRINQQIKAENVRLVGLPTAYTDGIFSLSEAMKIANTLQLDLIEISSKTSPVVCKIMEYSKFLYEIKKKEKESKKKNSQMKEMWLSPEIGDHDLETKARKSKEFLEKGDKVRATLLFKGRTIAFKDRGQIVMLKFAELLQDVGVPESLPKLEGKKLSFTIKPIKK